MALIKGAVEGDSYRHFGSLGGFALHLATARRLGLIDPEDEHTATARAQALYRHHGLDRLPEGRAYLTWNGSPIVNAVLADLLPNSPSMPRNPRHLPPHINDAGRSEAVDKP